MRQKTSGDAHRVCVCVFFLDRHVVWVFFTPIQGETVNRGAETGGGGGRQERMDDSRKRLKTRQIPFGSGKERFSKAANLDRPFSTSVTRSRRRVTSWPPPLLFAALFFSHSLIDRANVGFVNETGGRREKKRKRGKKGRDFAEPKGSERHEMPTKVGRVGFL